jgi:hypothetical protein
MGTWVDTASNQCYSGKTLQNAVTFGYFQLKTGGTAIPFTDELLTKAQVESMVNVFTITGYAANQLVTKGVTITSDFITYLGNSSPIYPSSAISCASYVTVRGYYIGWRKGGNPSIDVGDVLYDSYNTVLTNGNGLWVPLKYNGTGTATSVRVSTTGVVLEVVYC